MGDCIIFLVISTEILVKKIIEIYYLKIEKKEKSEIEEIISDNSFKNLLDNLLPKIIGGNWNLKSKRNIASKWYGNVYKLRGRVVHGGYNPEYMETKIAIDETQEIHNYIIELMRKKRKKMALILEEFNSPYI